MDADKITKAEMIDIIYQKLDMNRSDIKMVLDIMLDSIKEALINNRTVELRGFGTFGVRVRKGRATVRNPRTGEIIPYAPHSTVFFRAGKEIKREMSQRETGQDAEPHKDEQPPDEENQ